MIRIRGARTHNLKNIDVDLPRNRLTVITGLSGSGKSSLGFDTLYAEGQRRYVESLSTYARQFLQLMEKPDVDLIEGLSPAIAIEQKASNHNPRSTVGTITEIHDYLRLLFARAGTPHCPDHPDQALSSQTISQMVDHLLALPEQSRLMITAPLGLAGSAEQMEKLLTDLRAQGFVRVRIDGELIELEEALRRPFHRPVTIQLVIDRLKNRPDMRGRLAESLETATHHGRGRVEVIDMETGTTHAFSTYYACPVCDFTLSELNPRLFSFNNPAGACPHCNGLGKIDFFDPERVVIHPALSLAGGAIRGWDRRNRFYFQFVANLADHYTFDPEQPFETLPENIRQIILYGSGEEKITFTYLSDGGREVHKKHPFEGIIPNMERRYHETDSQTVREELNKYRAETVCPDCQGSRLRRETRHVLIDGKSIIALNHLSLATCQNFFQQLRLQGKNALISSAIIDEIRRRLCFLIDVGLTYLSLDRAAETLSGGEAQRIRLASQIGSSLTGVMYVLDEPSIGLHQRDNNRLLNTLHHLRDMGNTVIVIEHDEEAILSADHIIDMGPGAGEHGGEVIATGTAEEIMRHPQSLTGAYLSGRLSIPLPTRRKQPDPGHILTMSNCHGNNLKQVDVSIPCGLLTCITGVSGSGKSTLINDTLLASALRQINRNQSVEPAPHDCIEGLSAFDKIVSVDQSPIGRTPRSTPASYTGLLTPVRELFAGVPEARARGYGPGRFSFNVKGGRCEACQGDGMLKVEMHFLPDMYVPCDLCHGKRYNRETLEIHYKGKNIWEVLDMTTEQAAVFFVNIPAVSRRLQTLIDVGLSYIRLGQNATTLSGGEAQRIKLALELSKRDTGRTLYILDEPTTGLHFQDVHMLLDVLHRLRDQGNTIIVIEHNLDVIKTADWIIDLGPEGGEQGGQILCCGTPEDVSSNPHSHTGHYLAKVLHQHGQTQ